MNTTRSSSDFTLPNSAGLIPAAYGRARRQPATELPLNDERLAVGHYAVGLDSQGLSYVVNTRDGNLLTQHVHVHVTVSVIGKNGKLVSMGLHQAVAKAFDPS